MEIKTGKLLTQECENELFKQYVINRDQKARNELIEANMGAALKFASPYCRRNPEMAEDLKAASLMGLCESVDHYKIDGGRKFCSYAQFWCRKRMLELIGQKIRNSAETVFDDLGNLPATEESSWSLDDEEVKVR